MSIAETFCQMNTLTETQIQFLARSRAKDTFQEVVSGVTFTLYKFNDGSTLVVGDDGYIGMSEGA